jgi:hypothetical protein
MTWTILPGVAGLAVATAAPIAISTGVGGYMQDFNSLPSGGVSNMWVDDSTLAGWYAQRTGTGTTFAADAGTTSSGNLYSYGTASDGERALGAIGSSGATAGSFAHGLQLQNVSGNAVAINSLAYVGDQWRKGGDTTAQVVTLWYRISASAITSLDPSNDSGWTALAVGDFSSPVNTAPGSSLIGNDAANRTVIAITANLNVPHGSHIMLRWKDSDHDGYDHGLAIDDVALTWIAGTDPVIVTPNLSPGAIAFVGFNADVNDALAFVALAPIAATDTIFFTDNAWNGATPGQGGAFDTGEGVITWVPPAGGLAAGTVVTLNSLSNSLRSASVGSVTASGSFNLIADGDTVYAYQGEAALAPTGFLAAITSQTTDVTSGTGLSASHIILLPGGTDVAAYTGPRNDQPGFAAYLTAIGNTSNWLMEDGTGDQSSNSIAPDIPFSNTAFTLAAAGLSYAAWLSDKAPGQAADDDHDHDGVANGVEFFMGESGCGFTQTPAFAAGKITWPRNPAANATYGVKTSTDLIHWETAPSGSVANKDNCVEYSLPEGSTRIFVRLEVLPNP